MFFQIEKVVLWSKEAKHKPRVIEFALNKVNLITGSSKSGKSSLIPIIDYCLGSSKCSIPVNTIRDTTAWYGVQIKTKHSRLLIARRDPSNQLSTSNAFFVEAENIEIPQNIEKHNVNIDTVKNRLNEISGVSNISFYFYDTGRIDKKRTSTRDLSAFNYQPQNIIANPNALFYKTDSFEHKSKLVTILPYVLGALSNTDIENQHRIKNLEEEYRKVERRLLKLKRQNEDWLSSAQAYVIKAMELGLVNSDKDIYQLKPERLLNVLKNIATKEIDYSTSAANIKYASEQEAEITKRSRDISNNLAKVKSRLQNINSMNRLANTHSDASRLKRERLSLSKWLLTQNDINSSLFSEPNEIRSLVLEPLARAFSNLEAELEVPIHVQGALSREKIYLEGELTRLASEMKDVNTQLKILRGNKRKLGYDAFSVGKFVGEVEKALSLMGESESESELSKEYKRLKKELSVLRLKIDPREFERKTKLQLAKVNKLASDWLPHLDTENPNAPISLHEKELTITVNSSGREDYLWEIGSGANWLSYHVAITLALHQHFSSLEASPVPNYIIYDQPSQVYFPSKLRHQATPEEDELALLEQDEDIVQVKKIFEAFNGAIEKTKDNLQIIVLDHAPSTLVKSIPKGHLVEEWRNGIKLIPLDWL
ncbi:TPA: DUF3732 domain-containing protein [Vibrio cholerae]|nr:DUF3732 domain-containing protein [Vibrio cholerae]HAS4945037.1 DUF3732 domain-containing protein [Vibrio cholerae]HAS4975185.1 DUF3732 domain-containing protein [Vibrio cholerae]HAS4977999.1 DUF3732 domain-containing protein [Vibrio cholerae]HAS4986288.1 DUF3732 domain-containing protein [Vibrio cholerae]